MLLQKKYQQANKVSLLTDLRLLRGFGLLELLFVIVVIVALLVTGLLYWRSNQQAVLVEAGYELIQDIVEASQGWQSKYADQGKYYGISANKLLREGNIPSEYITNFDGKGGHNFSLGPLSITIGASTGLTTPWHGDSQVNVEQAEDKPGVLHITFTKIPNYACVNLANRINGENSEVRGGTDSAQCHVKGTNVIGHITSFLTSKPESTLEIWYSPDF